MRRAAWTLSLALMPACKDEAPSAIEIPSEVHGLFGRDASDLALGTLGLEIDATSVRFSEMTLTVTDGKLVGDTFHIGRAEVRWTKDGDDKLPKECKGTLERAGPRLLIALFKKDSDEPCESILKGEWSEWKTTTEFPEAMRGVFGGSDPYGSDASLTIGEREISTPGETPLVLARAVQFVDRKSELIVVDASVGDQACKGTIAVDDDELSGSLGDCAGLYGTRWTVSPTAMPSGMLGNGKVAASFESGKVTLTNQDETTCTQKVLRTTPRPTTDRGRDHLPVLAGQVLLLEPATPERADACAARVTNLYRAECRERMGGECTDEDLPAPDVRCPTHLVVGDPTGEGRKMALLPADLTNVACFDMTGTFAEKSEDK